MRIKNGFTFVELLVTLTIIGIVFASGIVTFTSLTTRSRDTRRKSDMEAIRQSLEMCRSLTGTYPDSGYIYQSDPANSSLKCGATGPVLMQKTPVDPRPCEGNPEGEYTYNKTSDTTYILSDSCMEVNMGYQVTNP